jgi:hypothetical protein
VTAALFAQLTGAALRATSGSALYLALIALLSLGVAAIVRDSAIASGTVLALLYLFPILSSKTQAVCNELQSVCKRSIIGS